MRALALILLGGFIVSAQAQDWELGARYWHSRGFSQRSHNAQVVEPTLGNPTSVLTYQDLDANTVELHARRRLGTRWFVRGNAGLGWIHGGTFEDEDFLAGQVRFSDSISPVKGNRLAYGTIDVGRDLWQLRNTTIGLFVGYQQWTERLDAYGATFTTGGASIPESVPVITNEITWQSLRLGIAAAAHMGPKTRLSLDAAWVPYAEVRDEDSHYLRTAPSDLGPTPNIIVEGHGSGMQLDAELRHAISANWELGAGFRYWRLRATRGTRMAVGTSLPLNEIESWRRGLILDLTRRW